MTHLKQLKVFSTQTIISEFRIHLGKYWRDAVNRNAITVIRKSFNDDDAAVLMSKKLFDRAIAKQIGIAVPKPLPLRKDRIVRVMHGPFGTIRSMAQIVKELI